MPFVPDAQQPTRFVPDAPAAPPATVGNTIGGAAEVGGAAAANIPGGILNGIIDLVSRAAGQGARSPIPSVTPGQAGQNLIQRVKGALPSTPNGLDVSDEELRSVDPTGKVPIEQLRAQYQAQSNKSTPELMKEGGIGPSLVGNALQVGGDVGKIAGGAALVRGAAGGVGALLDNTVAKAPATAAGALGYRGADSITGKVLAGSSAGPALIEHNAAIGNSVVGNEAGLAKGVTPSYETLAAAREAPNDVYNRAAASLPPGPLDQAAQDAVKTAGQPDGGRVSQGSPQAQAQIEALRSQLLSPATTPTGRTWINELRGLRQEGFTNVASDDVSNQQLGKAQLDMADAVEGHIGRNLPPGGDVSLDQFQDARKALAKNYTAQSALRGDTFDLRKIASIQRASPTLLDGDMKTTADFANSNNEVVGQPNALNSPSAVKDVLSLNPMSHPLGSAVQAVGGTLGRRILTGGASPVRTGGLGAQFEPLANNASGESAASQEAINRGSRNVMQVDPDGNGSPVMSGVNQVDARAPQGHLLVDGDTGEILDRGGMNQRGAEGLRNRWQATRSGGLGSQFTP